MSHRSFFQYCSQQTHLRTFIEFVVSKFFGLSKGSLLGSPSATRYNVLHTSERTAPSSSAHDEGNELLNEQEALNSVKTQDEATDVIEKTFKEELAGYAIVPWKTFAKTWKGKAKVF